MTKEQWASAVDRMVAIWPGRRKLPEATVEAWYKELGSWADAEVFQAVITRLGKETEKAPGLATLVMATKDAGGDPRRKHRAEDEEPSDDDKERWARLAKDWIFINRCRYHPAISELLRGLLANEADPGDTRLALLAEIEHLGVKPRDPETGRERGEGGLTPIGESMAV